MNTTRTSLFGLTLQRVGLFTTAALLFAGTSGCKKDPAKPSGAPAPAPAAEKPAGEGPQGSGSGGGSVSAAAEGPGGAAAEAGGDSPAAAAGGDSGKPAAAGDSGGAAAGGDSGKPAEAAADSGEPAAAADSGEKPAEAAADSGEPAAAGADSGEKPAEGAAADGGEKPPEGDKPVAAAPPAEEAENKDPTAAPKDVAAPPADSQKTPSGLASKVLKPGTSERAPTAEDTVKVHYTGWTTDGKMFDSSRVRGEPTTFPLNGVIAGWTEGVQLMKVGESRRFWIPEGLAYQGRPGAPAGMLVFDVELLDILEKPKAPADVKEPPADAERTSTGLASKVLRAGTGGKHPAATDMVKVHYSGWTTDGKMFDSSVARGEPTSFPLNRVIPGWTEGVQLMVEGEKRRLWIPEELAYKGRPGAPAGMLVFDVELISIGQ